MAAEGVTKVTTSSGLLTLLRKTLPGELGAGLDAGLMHGLLTNELLLGSLGLCKRSERCGLGSETSSWKNFT